MVISLLIFWLFFFGSLCQPQQRQYLRSKPWQDWLMDGLGLTVQGVGVPLLQLLVGVGVLKPLWPQLQGCLLLSPVLAFGLSFVAIDYLYYWSHRLLHCAPLFPVHHLHHTLGQMDMVGASRNTLWVIFLLPYFWVNGLMLYLLAEPWAYGWGIVLTCLLDLWRHSSLVIVRRSWLYAVLNPWLMLPQDHGLHHQPMSGRSGEPIESCQFNHAGVNFGANLKLWDYLHHTYQTPDLSMQSQLNGEDLERLAENKLEPLFLVSPKLKALIWPF